MPDTIYIEEDGSPMLERQDQRVRLAPRPPDANRLNLTTGKWETDPQMAAAAVRAERNHRLRESDWSQLADIPPTTSTAWRRYRQALRDLPDQAGFPLSINWPEPPTN